MGVVAMTITTREIKDELEKIYKERKRWDGAKGPFTKSAIRRREVILIKQQLLYQIEDAKLMKDKSKELFNLTLLHIINNYLKELECINDYNNECKGN
jgi:hypothetical protein